MYLFEYRMNEICLRAYGKVNIGLDITGKRADGYHLLKTVMQTVDVFDELRVQKTERGICVKTDREEIPDDERNLAWQAAEKIFERYDLSGGVRIEIAKRIPVGGGMAGGSTDGAGTIAALDRLYNLSMSQKEKDEIAVTLGADVPFCLRKGTWLAEGIGQQLTKLPDLPALPIVVCAPGFPVSTPWAYRTYDEVEHPYHPDMEALLLAIENNHLQGVYSGMGNALEPIVQAEYPVIGILKNELLAAGAKQALMTGSGSTVFGIFDNRAAAAQACSSLKQKEICSTIFTTSLVKGD